MAALCCLSKGSKRVMLCGPNGICTRVSHGLTFGIHGEALRQ